MPDMWTSCAAQALVEPTAEGDNGAVAGRGPVPGDASERRRPNSAPKVVTLTADGRRRGPQLPRDRPWHPMVRRWWTHLRQSPQSSVLSALDWDYATDVALLLDGFWRSDGADNAAELRLRQAKLGCTVEDRMRLRWRVDDPPGSSPSPEPSPYRHLRPVAESAGIVDPDLTP